MFSGKLHLSTKAILGLIVLMLFASTLLLQSEVFRKPTYSWNQKVTITVETEEGVFSSYTVQRVEWKYNGPSRPGLEKNYWSMTLHGEAPFVVLPDETVIVATLGGGDRWGFGRLLIEELEGSDYNSSLSPSEEVVQRVEVASDLNTYVYSPTQVPPIIIGISPSKSPQNSFWVSPEDQTSEALGITSVKLLVEKSDRAVSQVRITEILPWINEMEPDERLKVKYGDGSIGRIPRSFLSGSPAPKTGTSENIWEPRSEDRDFGKLVKLSNQEGISAPETGTSEKYSF